MALEILTGSPELQPSTPEEDKAFFKRDFFKREHVPPMYVTKCDTVYFTVRQMFDVMKRNRHLRVVWTIRDPRDMAMSKLRRGCPKFEGGDCKSYAKDGTPAGCVEDIFQMWNMHTAACANKVLRQRIMTVRMEDMITDTEHVARVLATFAGIEYHPAMVEFWKRMRNVQKAKRYRGLDRSQLYMWKRWETAYGGWLAERYDMGAIFADLEPVTEAYGYAAV
jgi:hypothetical protein